MRRSLLVAVLAAMMVVAMGASTAFAGEVTGNGKDLWTGTEIVEGEAHHTLHGKSACAFSGQEDDQFFTGPLATPIPEDDVVKGSPGHAQSWGQIPKGVDGDDPPGSTRAWLTANGFHPSKSCNPTTEVPEP